MKIKNTLCYFLLLYSVLGFSQHIQWAVKDTSIGSYGKKLACDKDSNIYIYGQRYTSSLLEKFSANGNMLLYKSWTDTFFVNKLLYDGNQSFYFAATFSGNVTVDGIPLSSKGGTDGVVGQMDLSGTVQWMKVFGSSKDEVANWLCFGPSNNSIIVTGKTTDSLIYNNVYMSRNTQSTLIAQISLSGTLLSYKLHDFLPQRDNVFNGGQGLQNVGIEITEDHLGNYFLFTEREGKFSNCCSGDTINAPEQGRYLMKLNAGFDTLWTRFIIGPGCYYGWDGRSLMSSSNGDAYIVSYCSGHYGGDGVVQRLSNTTGATVWSETHMDGAFNDIFVEGNTLYSCNTDSATYCPCPSQNPGYEDVRKTNQNNTMVYELKFDQTQYQSYGLQFDHITRDLYGNTFVQGAFNGPYVVLGGDTIHGDPAFGNTGRFLMKLSDTSFATVLSAAVASSFNVYPNPANSGTFEISFPGTANESVLINIIDASGRSVYRENVTLPQNELKKKIDLGNNAKGLYLIEVLSKNGTSSRKVMME
ncbi:MAG: T9SS type A sorting domain-containing protein [Bacteroidia bacterium]